MTSVVSRTAQSMALFRALETASSYSGRLINDPYALRCLPAGFRALARIVEFQPFRGPVEAAIDWRYPGARTSGVARTRLIDDWLQTEVAAGIEQIVILGAGFDSRSLRLPELHSIPVFEVDHELVLSARDHAFEQPLDENRKIVAIDFLKDCVSEKLLEAGFERGAKSLVLWEGVTNYLTASAVTDVFQAFSKLSSVESTVIFTYVHEDVLDNSFKTIGLERLKRRLARWGEPWTFGLHPRKLAGFLNELGYGLVDDLGADQYRRIYYGPKAEGLTGYEFYRVAKARLQRNNTEKESQHATC